MQVNEDNAALTMIADIVILFVYIGLLAYCFAR
jgi:hypothetical protein